MPLAGLKKRNKVFNMAIPIAAALLVSSIAQVAGRTLNRSSIFPKIAITDYENKTFEIGETTTIRVARTKPAVNFDPRVAPFTPTEGSYASDTIVLERLWTNGFPVYAHDAPEAVKKYIVETGNQCAKGIAPENDTYMYQKFRTVPATTGAVQYFASAPLAIVANVDAVGNFTVFDSGIITNAGAVLDIFDVPADTNDRFIVMSSMAKASFLKDAIRVTGFAQAIQGSGKLIETGLDNNQFIPTYGFNCGASNTVSGQIAVADMDTVTGNQPELILASSAQDTTKFFDSQKSTATPLGTVDFTLTAATALSSGVAVGQIAQIRDTNNVPKAHLVILRIDSTTSATAPVITGVPFSPSGSIMTTANFVAGDKLRIPAIGSVNVANHREGLLLSSRPIVLPAADSGAVGATVVEPDTQIAINVIKGIFDSSVLKQNITYHALLGAKFANWKMGALMLTA